MNDKKLLESALSFEIMRAYEKLISSLSHVSLQFLFEKKIEKNRELLSCANIVAYQIGWGKLLISWYENGCNNAEIVMPGEGFTKWDYNKIAHHFYQKYASHSFEELKYELERVVEKIIEITEKEYKTGNLDKIGGWSWCTLKSGKQWPLSKWIRVNTVAPYTKAALVIRNYCRSLD